jgi:hypothetical protein
MWEPPNPNGSGNERIPPRANKKAALITVRLMFGAAGGIAPIPSMAGARLRQLSLSKIVPYDFVEPPTVGGSQAPSA